MTEKSVSCVLLADHHRRLSEGVCGLLETIFDVVVMVANETSLLEGVLRLQPELAVVDVSLAPDSNIRWLPLLRERYPTLKLIVLSVHDEPSVRKALMEAGADGFILKRTIATDLLPTVESVLAAPARRASSGCHPRQTGSVSQGENQFRSECPTQSLRKIS